PPKPTSAIPRSLLAPRRRFLSLVIPRAESAFFRASLKAPSLLNDLARRRRHSAHEPFASLSASLNALMASLYLPSSYRSRPWESFSIGAEGLGGSARRGEERKKSMTARPASTRLRR